MKHMIFALLAGFIFMAASPVQAKSFENDPDVQKAEAYLKNLKTAKADFIQTASTGSRLSGQFYLDRPGKLRFNYNEVKDFIVADGIFIYFYDSDMGEQTNAPIGQTLADFLLRKDLRLRGDLSVQQVYKKDGMTNLTIVQKDDPSAGHIELVFSDVPFELNRWRVIDAQGATTEIVLKNLQTGVKLDKNLFAYRDPKGRKMFNN